MVSPFAVLAQEDCADFVEAREITKKDISIWESALNRFRGRSSADMSPMGDSASYTLRQNLSSPTRSIRSQALAKSLSLRRSALSLNVARSVEKEEYSELQLKTVRTRDEMKAWIRKFKSEDNAQDRPCCAGCCGWDWMERQFGSKVCRCGETQKRQPLDRTDKTKQIPMDLLSEWMLSVFCPFNPWIGWLHQKGGRGRTWWR